jgi:GTP-binding protein EngB required for normal cell division
MAKVLGLHDICGDDTIIALMGPTGAGKSTFINVATGQKGRTVGHKLKSCTSDIRAVRYIHPQDSRPIVFVDTPGFDDTHKSDTEILKIIADWLEKTYGDHNKLAGIIYLHRISDNRMAGTPLKNLRMFANLCGDDATKNVILATTMWELVQGDEGERRLEQLKAKYWKGMIEKGSTVTRFESQTFESAWNVVGLITGKPSGQQAQSRPLLIQEEMVDLEKQLSETQAGITLYGTLQKLLAEQQETIRQLRDEAQLQNNPQLVEDLNAQYEAIRENLRKTFDQVQEMKISFGRRFLALFKWRKTRARSIQIP